MITQNKVCLRFLYQGLSVTNIVKLCWYIVKFLIEFEQILTFAAVPAETLCNVSRLDGSSLACLDMKKIIYVIDIDNGTSIVPFLLVRQT